MENGKFSFGFYYEAKDSNSCIAFLWVLYSFLHPTSIYNLLSLGITMLNSVKDTNNSKIIGPSILKPFGNMWDKS